MKKTDSTMKPPTRMTLDEYHAHRRATHHGRQPNLKPWAKYSGAEPPILVSHHAVRGRAGRPDTVPAGIVHRSEM